MLADLVSSGKALPSSEDLVRVGSAVEGLSAGQQVLQDKTAELLSRLVDMPEGVVAAIKTAQDAHAELLARAVTKEDFEEVRKLMATNADLQVQLNKARSQFGAVRAEKDLVMERLAGAEAERDLMRAKVDEVQVLRERDAEMARARARELEEAISQSLARLKTSDVTIESQQERVLELEKLNRDLTAEKEAFVSKVSFSSLANFVTIVTSSEMLGAYLGDASWFRFS
jgi:chromosome segregation ATPase